MTTDKLIANARMWVDFFDPRSIVDSDILTKLCDTLERQQKEIDALRGFAKTVVDASPDSADELLAIMLEHNILTPCMYLEPCCDDCQCWENGKEFPNPCYRRTPLLTGETP